MFKLSLFRKDKVSCDGIHFAKLAKEGNYEPLTTEVIKKEVKRGNTILDIGANIGYFTLIFARLVGKEGKVFAFEPETNNFTFLKKNIRRKRLQNVTLIQKAVSNETGKARLYLCAYNVGNRMICNSGEGRMYIEVETVRLDEYFKNYGNIDFIKMDIQGAEWIALEGMLNLLRKNKNLKIIIEFTPDNLKKFGVEPQELPKLLLEHGFKLYDINEHLKSVTPTNIDKLLKMYPKEYEFTNLLCLK
jgi:FkbM family methyltransferase